MANRLKNEVSVYLRQHADNPVDWYPWGEEALAAARESNRPILLSVGYSACHWCHVMAHESFEDPDTAALMNEHFVCIKVDREERPDIDAIYMGAVQALTGSGGWPLTVFLSPDGKPFYGGTYFPPEDRYNLPGFQRLLRELAAAYRERGAEVAKLGDQLLAHIDRQPAGAEATELPDLSVVCDSLPRMFDHSFGGFGNQPKFPQPAIQELLLRLAVRYGDEQALEMAERTLLHMAAGGMYDQAGGGFHRYSVDRHWTVPHFEKMLYDNAQLASLYLHAYQLTGRPNYARIVRETLDYLLREMQAEGGGFYASQDADSEGREGIYYVWTPAQLEAALGSERAAMASRFFGLSERGNFDGANILTRRRKDEDLAAEFGLQVEELQQQVEVWRSRLYAERSKRVAPGTDTKIIAAWNGMAVAALAEAGASLEEPRYLAAAERCADFLLTHMYAGGRLYHTDDQREPRLEGFLQDYAFVAGGLLSLYNVTLNGRWLEAAQLLAESISERFRDEAGTGFYDSGVDHEELVLRPRSSYDNAVPAGSSQATRILLWLAALAGDEARRQLAEASLRAVASTAVASPLAHANWLAALDFATSSPRELVVTGDPAATQAATLAQVAARTYEPNLLILGSQGMPHSPLLEGRAATAEALAYFCRDFVCLPPFDDGHALLMALEEATPSGGGEQA